MKPLTPQPGLTEQVYQALLDAMTTGALAPGQHLVQEQLASDLGVSRQPVQQALAMLRNDGLVQELGRRGLFVTPLEAASMRQRYEIRATLDGLAARLAAERARSDRDAQSRMTQTGSALVAAGRAALRMGDIAAMVKGDIAFHEFVYEASGNPLIAQTAAMHWRHLRRVMGEVLRTAEPPAAIWHQHEDILDAILAGQPARAHDAAVSHVWTAAERLERTLTRPPEETTSTPPARRDARAASTT